MSEPIRGRLGVFVSHGEALLMNLRLEVERGWLCCLCTELDSADGSLLETSSCLIW